MKQFTIFFAALFIAVFLHFFPISVVMAEDVIPAPTEAGAQPLNQQNSDPEQAIDPETQKKAEKYKNAASKAYDAVKEIGKDLKDDDARHFYMLYNNYNLIGTVKMVQTDVGNAVKACGESNPGLKNQIDTRFQAWDKEVGAIVTEAEANTNNMIVAQEYADAGKIKSAFKMLDEARVVTNSYIDKQPVTTEDACKHLLNKMDDTQENLTELLRKTLISFARTTSGKVQ